MLAASNSRDDKGLMLFYTTYKALFFTIMPEEVEHRYLWTRFVRCEMETSKRRDFEDDVTMT